MQPQNMTVAEITHLLENTNALTPDMVASLRQDARSSVRQLLTRWESRLASQQKEMTRVQAMYRHERELAAQGFQHIAGIDEAGRGPLAGPVVMAAVILPLGCHLPLLNDSKQLTPKQRETLYGQIHEAAIGIQFSVIDVEQIDTLNIYQATVYGMYKTLAEIAPRPDAVLIDAVPLRELAVPSRSIIGGDAISASIAAASIIAKVERDHIMMELDQQYPMYGFCRHKGYGTKEHLRALQEFGPCPQHRKSFEPIRSWGEGLF